MYAILLAAGLSTRMGCQKLMLPIGNSTMVEKVLERAREAKAWAAPRLPMVGVKRPARATSKLSKG